jgi:hypothetical protein
MEESSNDDFNFNNSIESKPVFMSTDTTFEKYYPIYNSKDLNKQIIKSITHNLREIIKENIHNNQMKYVVKSDLFYLSRLPPISIEDYIKRIFNYTKMNLSSLILSIIYIDRFCESNGYILSLNNIHRILLAACLLSIKFNEDININTKYYANVAGVSVTDLNNLEYYFYVKLKFSLYIDYDFYQKYFEYFCKNINVDNKKYINSDLNKEDRKKDIEN